MKLILTLMTSTLLFSSLALAKPAACGVKATPLSQIHLADSETALKLDMTSTSRRTQVKHKGFHLLNEGDTDVLSLMGIGFRITGRTLAYACVSVDEASPADDRVEILFHSVNSRDLVHRSPLEVIWQPLDSTHTILGGIFSRIPLIGPALGALNDAINIVAGSIQDRLHDAVGLFKKTGVDRIVITRDAIELSVGVSLFNGALHGADSPEFTPFTYTIPLKDAAE